MENPSTWTPVHYLINKVLADHEQSMKAGVIGLSLASKIVEALKEKGYLKV